MGNDAKLLYKEDDCIAYRVSNGEGELEIKEYQVFPGIWLCYKDAHTQKLEFPPDYPEGLLEIIHCREGRYEYDAGEHFFYLSAGDMSVSKSKAGGTTVYCPTKHYHGISILIDPDHAPHCLSCFLEDVEVSPTAIMEKFCKEQPCFIMRSTKRLEHVFSELYSVPEDMKKGYFKVKILELLMFLNGLDISVSQTGQHSCSKAQVVLAKQICEYVNTHMEVRFTIEQLAEQFHISPTWLKKCFYSVYGESVQAYIREYKLHVAANELRHSDKTITEIANDIGYGNNSKFSEAFRSIFGVSPREYRNKQ